MSDSLREQIHAWVVEGQRQFVMDFAGVDLLNSIGLGRLVSYYTTLTREGGTLHLARMNDRHRRAAYVARILDLFEDHSTVEDAVAAAAARAEVAWP